MRLYALGLWRVDRANVRSIELTPRVEFNATAFGVEFRLSDQIGDTDAFTGFSRTVVRWRAGRLARTLGVPVDDRLPETDRPGRRRP